MYHLYCGNDLRELLKDRFGLFTPADVFGRSLVCVVQNKNLEHWLKLEICNNTGVYANVRFIYPDQAIREITAGFFPDALAPKPRVLYRDEITIRIFKLLEHPAADDLFPDLTGYFSARDAYVQAGAESSSGQKEQLEKKIRIRRILDFAGSLAEIFYNYGLNYPELIQCWARGAYLHPEGTAARVTETWQRVIYMHLFPREGIFRMLPDILSGCGEPVKTYAGKLSKIIIIGSSFLSELEIQINPAARSAKMRVFEKIT